MRPAGLICAILAIATAAAPSSAQEEPALDAAMARVIHAALAPSNYGDWRYRWDAVSIRISSLMHWHLPGPDRPGEDAITRHGWISANGRQIGVTAHGEGETVTGLALEYSGWPGFESARDQLIEALAAQGVAAAETSRSSAPDFYHTDEPVIVYRLSAEGRDKATLTQKQVCTSPRSASAQRCDTTYLLAFDGG